jgi:chromosome partitioning protein
VPSKADQLSALSISYFSGSVDDLVADYNAISSAVAPISPKFLGVVFSMVEVYDRRPTRAHRAIIGNVAKNAKMPVFDSFIRDASREAISSVQAGIPTIIRPGAETQLAAEFAALRDEFLKRIEEA